MPLMYMLEYQNIIWKLDEHWVFLENNFIDKFTLVNFLNKKLESIEVICSNRNIVLDAALVSIHVELNNMYIIEEFKFDPGEIIEVR